MWSGIYGEQYQQALQTRAVVGDTVLAASYARADRPGLEEFLQTLPEDTAPVWIENIMADDPTVAPRTVVTGSCPALQVLGLPCGRDVPVRPQEVSSTTTEYLLMWLGGGAALEVRVEATPDLAALGAAKARLSLVSLDGRDLSWAQLQRAAYASVSGGLGLEPLGQGYVTQGSVLTARGLWVVLLGLGALVIVTVPLGAALAGDAMLQARSLVPLVALTERRRWLFTMSLIRSGTPLFLAGVLGSLCYLWTSTGLATPTDPIHTSTTLALGSVVCAAAVGVLSSGYAAYNLSRYAQTWKPGSETWLY